MLGEVFVDAGRDQLFHAETNVALLAVDGEDLRFDYLAGLEHIARMRDALLVADLADVHHAFHAFRELNKRAKVGDAGDRTFDGGADREFLRNVGPRIAERLLQSKADAAFGRVHREDDGVNGVAGLHDVGNALHFARPREFGDVNEAFDAGFEFDEGAEVRGARDYAANTLANCVLPGGRVPRMRLELFQADGDAAFTVFFRGLEDLDFDLLADREDVRGLLDARPADFADVQRASTPPRSTNAP